MKLLKSFFISTLIIIPTLLPVSALAGQPKYTYEQVYDTKHIARRFIVLDQKGFRLTYLLQKLFAPDAALAVPEHLKHIHPSFWASPDNGSVGFQGVFEF